MIKQNENPIQKGSIIRNTLFMGNIVWRDRNTHELMFIEKQYSRYKESMTYILFDVHSNNYLANKTLFNKTQSKYFHTLNEAQNFILEYEKFIFYNDFIKQTIYFFSKNIHPLQKSGIYIPYCNPVKRNKYYGINWFSIFYKTYINKNQNCKYYYSMNEITERNLTPKINAYNIIVEIQKEKYELITPENCLTVIPKTFFNINKQTLEYSSQYANDKTIYFLENKINYFFYCIKHNCYYESDKYTSKYLKKIINENPEIFISICNHIFEEGE